MLNRDGDGCQWLRRPLRAGHEGDRVEWVDGWPTIWKRVTVTFKADDAPELVPYLHFAWLCNVLAGVAAPLGDSYETFAVDGDAQGSSSAPPDGPDDDPLVPYGAFKFVAEAVGALQRELPISYHII